MTKKQGKYLSGFSLLLAGLMAAVFVYNWNDIYTIFVRINIAWAFAGFVFHFVNYIFRGIRLKIIAGSPNISFYESFGYSVFHGVISYLMPMQTGDISLPVLLKTTGKIGLKTGVGILVKLRLLDMSMLGCLSFFAALVGARMISPTVHAAWILASILLAVSIFVFQYLGEGANFIARRFFQISADISHYLKFDPIHFFITGCIWISICLSQYCMIQSIGLDLRISEVVFLSTIQFPLQLLPLQGFANSGNHEGGWIVALTLMGFNGEQALDYALASHGVLIVYVALLGLMGGIVSNKKLGSFLRLIWPIPLQK